ncbi:hypothetical protein NC652_036910 [Populus alba x Populus x berolinensis]|nr:hypothetical protein NC652_036910 [Populus alba x Populus x berolinensis]
MEEEDGALVWREVRLCLCIAEKTN